MVIATKTLFEAYMTELSRHLFILKKSVIPVFAILYKADIYFARFAIKQLFKQIK